MKSGLESIHRVYVEMNCKCKASQEFGDKDLKTPLHPTEYDICEEHQKVPGYKMAMINTMSELLLDKINFHRPKPRSMEMGE